ncbi:MAG TPA: hypothetical protein VGK38_06370 [Prolixibacteraceae bacterium]|jgi:hypothetical protein
MKKVTYLFVMIVGMTLATLSVNAQDAKSTTAPVKKEATACCKDGGKMADGKTCTKGATASADATKGTSATSQKVSDKSGACCKSKSAATASEAKVSKTVD